MAIKLGGLKAKTKAVAVDLFLPNGDELLDEDGKTQAQAFVFGQASTQYRDFEKAKGEKLLERMSKGKKNNITSFDSLRKDSLALVVACTEKITVIETDEGDALDNPVTIEAVLSDPQFGWLLDQVSAAINDQSNFI